MVVTPDSHTRLEPGAVQEGEEQPPDVDHKAIHGPRGLPPGVLLASAHNGFLSTKEPGYTLAIRLTIQLVTGMAKGIT